MSEGNGKNFISAFLGNILEKYDHALFGLLAPFLSPLFFAKLPYTTGLILTYSIQIVGLLTRPLGSLVFGYIGDKLGRKQSLAITITGMAITTCAMGCIPTSVEIGTWAPVCLATLRACQNFFAAGESSGAAIFLLEHTHHKHRTLMSSLYDASSVLGFCIASILVTMLCQYEVIETRWRILFWLGGLSGIPALWIRYFTAETPEFVQRTGPFFNTLRIHIKSVIAVAVTSGFSHVTYYIPFVFMAGFAPVVSPLSPQDILQKNSVLLIFDILLLPLFGYLCRYIPSRTIMIVAASCLIVCPIPVFLLLRDGTAQTFFFAQTLLLVFGVAFAAPWHQWTLSLLPPEDRCTIASFGNALGAQWIGAPTCAVCLSLFQMTGFLGAPALYIIGSATLATIAVWKVRPHRTYQAITKQKKSF